jgi:transcriptional regulator with XRE-family HTH domain
MPTKSKESNIIQKSMGHVIRTLRFKLNLTQSQLAEKAGLDRTYIGDIEIGGRNIALRTFFRLAAALEVSPDKFMKLLTKQLEADNKEFDWDNYLEKDKWVERG